MPNKRFGYLAEQIFTIEAMKRNYDVLCPIGEYLPIDFVVMNGAGGLLKTQVKATNTLKIHNGAKRYAITASVGSTEKKPIDCTKVDILACYIMPENQWYIIPCLALSSNICMWFYPHNPKSKGQFEKYKDNWEAFNSK